MSIELLKKLGVALGVLVVAWLGIEIIRDRPGDGVTVIEMPDLTSSEIDSVIIRRAVDAVTLKRLGDNLWSVNGFRADSAAVVGLMDGISEDIRAELVAQNSASHGRFSIADQEARRVLIYRGDDSVLDLLVGKRGRDFQQIYLRWPDDDDVYVARTQLGTMVDRPLNDWRDKGIVAVAADSIAEVVLTNATGSYTLARGDSGLWSLDGGPADSAAVVRLLNQFGSLNSSGFPTEVQMDSVDFDRPERQLVLRDASRSVLAELLFDSTAASGYWVRRTGDTTVFRLDRFRVDQLVPADSTLRPGT